ncbi:uncharacterized protein LOC141585418 [Saimiri boliviensis]|uniref:uncharacterized protein LOC141585418 n=1 Tax=Saimiri boliviensis TaxID=27679 RepID=UPI003D77955A
MTFRLAPNTQLRPPSPVQIATLFPQWFGGNSGARERGRRTWPRAGKPGPGTSVPAPSAGPRGFLGLRRPPDPGRPRSGSQSGASRKLHSPGGPPLASAAQVPAEDTITLPRERNAPGPLGAPEAPAPRGTSASEDPSRLGPRAVLTAPSAFRSPQGLGLAPQRASACCIARDPYPSEVKAREEITFRPTVEGSAGPHDPTSLKPRGVRAHSATTPGRGAPPQQLGSSDSLDPRGKAQIRLLAVLAPSVLPSKIGARHG